MEFTFLVEGKAEGKDRPRFARGHVFTPQKTKDFEARVKTAAAEAMSRNFLEPTDEPVRVEITCFFLPPKSATKKFLNQIDNELVPYDKKPDADNVAKAVCDAMNGVVFVDDKQVCYVSCEKWFTRDRDSFFVRVRTIQ